MNENIVLELPAEHASRLAEYYQKRLKELLKETSDVTAILSSLTKVKGQTQVVAQPGIQLHATFSGNGVNYNPKWSFIKKAKFAIKEQGRPLTTTSIVNLLLESYEVDPKPERKRFLSSMSGVLSADLKKAESLRERRMMKMILNIL